MGTSSGKLSDYPPHDQWMNFVDMFELNNRVTMSGSGSTAEQIQEIRNAIIQVSLESRVDPRLILAVIIQEVCRQRFAYVNTNQDGALIDLCSLQATFTFRARATRTRTVG